MNSALIAAVLLVGADTGSASSQSFRHVELGFVIVAPPAWTVLESEGADFFVEAPLDGRDDRFAENCNVTVLPRSRNRDTPDRWWTAARRIMDEGMTEFTDVEWKRGTLSGLTSVEVAYLSRQGALRLKSRMYVALTEDREVILTCNAEASRFDAYEPVFDATAESLELSPAARPIPEKTPRPIPGVWEL